MAFRLGAADAQVLEPEFEPQIKRQDLVRLPNYRACIKMSVDGAPQLPTSLTTVVPSAPTLHEGQRDTIIRVSRERYAVHRIRVEQRIERWIRNVVSSPP